MTAWVRGVNAHLAADAAVLWAHPVARRVPCAVRRDRAPLHLPAAESRASVPACSAGRVGWYHQPLDVDAMQAAVAHVDRHPRFLVVSCRGVSGEIAGQDACPRARRARRRSSCASIFPPTRFSITWCATSSAHLSRSARARRRRLDRRASRGARPHARPRRRSPPKASTSRAPTTTRASVLPPTRPRSRGDEDARQDLRHHARRRRRLPRATPAPMRSASFSGAARRASSKWAVRARSRTRCRRS